MSKRKSAKIKESSAKRFDKIDSRLAKVEKRVDKIDIELVQIKSKMFDVEKGMVTKEEYRKDQGRLMTVLDRHTKILEKLDQERIFTIEWIRGIEHKVNNHEKEIGKLKMKVQ